MTNLPTAGGAWTRDEQGGLRRADAEPAQKPAPEPAQKPAKKEADK